jgi:hypothetical protein
MLGLASHQTYSDLGLAPTELEYVGSRISSDKR